jgi:hypothetical protein
VKGNTEELKGESLQPPDATDTFATLLETSKRFYDQYSNSLPQGYGMIAQSTTQSSVNTLIFDARGRQNDKYIWQLMHTVPADFGNYSEHWAQAQQIWQIELSPETTQGKFYALNRQGALTNTKSLEDTELIYILSRVADLLNSTEAKTEADKRLAHTGGFIALSLYEPSGIN